MIINFCFLFIVVILLESVNTALQSLRAPTAITWHHKKITIDEIVDHIYVRTLLNDIKIAIKSRNYTGADEGILELGVNSSKINVIVHDIYANRIGNFPVLTRYAEASSHPEISCRILLALWVRVKDNGHVNMDILSKIYTTLSEKILDLEYTDISLKSVVENIMISEIRPIIVVSVGEQIALSLVNEFSIDVQEGADTAFALSESIFDDAIGKGIDEAYESMQLSKLLTAVWNLQLISQKAAALVAIFRKTYSNGKKGSNEFLLIADYFRQLVLLDVYSISLNAHKEHAVNGCIKSFPQSVRILYFRGRVCFQNAQNKEFLYAATKYDEWNHRVNTTERNNTRKTKHLSEWYPVFYRENMFKFENAFYKNEHLYVGEILSRSYVNQRKVFTWWAKGYVGNMNNRLVWRVYLMNNGIQLVNEFYNEYLCLAKHLRGADSAFVTERMYTNSGCRWFVTNCSE